MGKRGGGVGATITIANNIQILSHTMCSKIFICILLNMNCKLTIFAIFACKISLVVNLHNSRSEKATVNNDLMGISRPTDEQRILSTTLSGYDTQFPPVNDTNKAVVVKIGLNLIQIFDIDEKNQVLIANCWIDLEWVDEYMRYAKYSSIALITFIVLQMATSSLQWLDHYSNLYQRYLDTRYCVSIMFVFHLAQ